MAGLWEREPLAPKIAEVAGGSFARRSPSEIVGTGYVVKSLEAALWAFATTGNYRDGCLAAVNLGMMRIQRRRFTDRLLGLSIARAESIWIGERSSH